MQQSIRQLAVHNEHYLFVKTMEMHELNIFTDYHIRRVLGRGGEGIVYLVEDKERLGKLVLKVFHEPRTSDWLPGLKDYASKIKANDFGLPEVQVLFCGDKIIGVVYPYVQLRSLHWRILGSIEKVAQSVIGSYCHKQYYLMTEHELTLWDPHLSNFMVDKYGQWYYSDMGGGIGLLNHSYIFNHGLIGYGFANLMMSIYNKTLHHFMKPVEDYSYDDPCIYCKNEWLDDIATQHKWAQEILSEVRSHKSSIFYDPEFYRRISECLPSHVPWPSLILPLSKTLSWLGELRGKLGL